MMTAGFLLFLSLAAGVMVNTSSYECDMKKWYFRMSRIGVFDNNLTPDQQSLKKEVEKFLTGARYHTTKHMDCDLLARYEEQLTQGNHVRLRELETDTDKDSRQTEVDDETDLTDLDYDNEMRSKGASLDEILNEKVTSPDLKKDGIYRNIEETMLTTRETYKSIMTTRKVCREENINFVPIHNRNMDEYKRLMGDDNTFKFKKGSTQDDTKEEKINNPNKLVRNMETTTILSQETPGKNLNTRTSEVLYQPQVRLSEEIIGERDSNNIEGSHDISELKTAYTYSDNIPKQPPPKDSESDREMFEKIKNLLGEKEREYNLKIKTTELNIMRLENQLLIGKVDKQNDTAALLRLENKLLKLENELLKLNQKYIQMTTENEYLKQRQEKYNGLEQEKAQNTSKYLSLAYDKQNQLTNQHEERLMELNKYVDNQNFVIQNLKNKSEQLDQQITFLNGVIQNQSDAISTIANKTEMIKIYREEQKKEIDKLYLKIQQILSTPHIQKKWEHFLSDKLPLDKSKIKRILRIVSNELKHVFSRNMDANAQSNWCTGLSRKRKLALELLKVCTPELSWTSLTRRKSPEKDTKFFETESHVSYNLYTHDLHKAKAKLKILKPLDDFLSCTKIGLFISAMTISRGQLYGSPEVLLTLCHKAKIHPYCITHIRHSAYTSYEDNNVQIVYKLKSASQTVRSNPTSAIVDTISTKQDSVRTMSLENISEHDEPSTVPSDVKNDNKPQISVSDGRNHHHHTTEREAEYHDWAVRALDSGSEKYNPRDGTKGTVNTADQLEGGASSDEPSDNRIQDLDSVKNTQSSQRALGRNPSDSVVENRTPLKQTSNTASAKEQHTMVPSRNQCDGDEKFSRRCEKSQSGLSSQQKPAVNEASALKEEVLQDQDIQTNMHKNKPQQSTKESPHRTKPLYDSTRLREPKDCYDHLHKGKIRDGSYTVMLAGYKRVQVYCDIKNGGWTVFQRRTDGSTNFFKDWQRYKDGFGSKFGEHWLGNDAIHHLTNQDHYQLRFELSDWNKTKRYAQYDYFKIGSEKEGYQIHVDGYSGDAGDGLSKHNGMKFSTKDVDNDMVVKEFDGSCAKRFNGAWWYYRCYSSNLNGKYYRGGKVEEKAFDGVAWKPWTGPNYSLRTVLMKVRPHSVKTDID